MIPAIQEINFPSYATLHQATVSFTEMGERTISTQVRIDGDVVPDFTGWELSFKGERFILNTKDPQAVKDNSTRNSLVDLTFVSWPVNELKRYFFFEPTSIDASTAIADKYVASVNLPVEDFAVLFNKVLKYYFGDKVVFSLYMSGQGQYSTDRALVEINYTYIWDVLVKFFEIYGVRWRIEYDESDDVYTIKAGWPTTDIDINDHDFEYGYKGGLVRFERQVQDVDIHNILLGRGGEKNIPYRYFKRIDPQNPDWAADPDAIPELANIYFDRLRDINFRWYVRGWMQNPNHDTSWEEDGYTYPSYTISSDSPYYFAYEKGRTDEKFNPVEYVRDLPSIEDYGERWGALDDNDDIFPTIQGVTRDPLGRIDETVAVSEIVTDDISAMAQNAAVEKSINRLSVSLNGETRTEFDLQSEEFTIPSGSTGNITYVPFGTDDTYPGLVRFDTDNSSVVAVSDGIEYPIDAIPAGTYRLKLHMVIARSGQATSATGTFGIENIILTTSTQETDAWKPTFDIWVKNIWGTEKQKGETDVQYAERVWLPILGDRVGNEAKIVFSTGFMSVSEDYEFPIVSYPVHDTSKSINGVPSEWRITLRKSDAEFDATGLYIPNASTGGKPVAGDKFFFIGIDMPFRYVTLAEEDLNTYKSAQLDTEAAISPTWIMNLDKVRVHTLEDQEYGLTLSERLAAGGKVWIKDKRFTPGERLQLYVQSITYTWNEPTVESPYIVPDIEVVLSDKVVAVDSVVQRIQNDVSSIKNQYARISDVEAVVRSVAEPIFLKKTGESDSSDSPTQFSSKVTSKGFRQGGVGGTGWGIYRDNTSVWAEAEAETRTRNLLRAVAEERNTEGDTVFEADRIVVRKELQVNSLVINQISYLGGKEIISAAKIEVSKVIETDNGYVCYFDQRRNSVANNFVVNDIAMGQVFDPYNAELRYYKALVTAVDIDSITISKTQKVGSGVPRVGDVIVQYGNTTQSGRQYVIVRDVVGGGYERMLSGLNSLNADGDEYYFAGRESSGTGPRWFVGSHEQNGDYAEYENGVLTIKANVVFKAGQTIPGMSELSGEVSELSNDLANLDTSLRSLTTDVDALDYLKTALPKSDTIITGGLILSKVIALRDANNAVMSGINGDTSLSNIAAWYGGPMADKEASPTPASYAKSLFRFDGSGYLAGGNIYWNNQGYGGIPGITWSNDGTQDIVTIGANVRLASVDGDTVTDLLNAVNELMDLFEVVNGNIHVKNNRGFYSDSFISAGGLSDGGGSAGGNATLVAQTYGGTLSATGINPINFYSKEKVDELLLTAGSVRSVAGVSPVSGDIPVASLQSALGLGAAAYKAIGSVASGNTGLVTGGDVWTAIDELPEPMVFKGSLGTGGTITSLPAASSANEGFTYKVITAGTYRGTAAKVGDTFISNGSSWILIPSGDEPEGTVTSVGLSMPTGFSVSSSPITSSGTLTVAFASGYSLPTTAKQSNWDTAYGWGNHANAGYLLAATASSTYATITALNGVSGRVTTLEGRTNWDTYFGVDENGDIYVKKNGNTARNFYSWGAVSAGGLSSGGGSEGASLAAVWASLKTNSDDYANEKINAYHIPIGSGLSVVNGLIVANNAGTVTSVKVGTTTYNPTDGVVSLPAYPTSLPASDVYSWAKAETKPSYAFSEITGTASTSQIPTLAISKISGLQTALDAKQPLDADLTAIAGLTGTSGFLKKTAANTWALDTNTYLTGITSTMVTTALGYTPANSTALENYVLKSGDTMTGALTVNDTVSATIFKLKDGSQNLVWDAVNNAWRLMGNFYADGYISAGGSSSGGGPGSSSGGAILAGYVSVASVSALPDPGAPTLGYLVGDNLYLYVGTGGDTLSGKYQNCGQFRGPSGNDGEQGQQGPQGPAGPQGPQGPGIESVYITIDGTSGIPTANVELINQILRIAFSGLKGEQGNTGSSVDYPFTLVNNLTEGGTDKALTAEQGMVLGGRVSDISQMLGNLPISTDITANYTATANRQAYGNIGGSINTGALNGASYFRVDKSSIPSGASLRLTLNVGVFDASSYIQFVNSSNIITRRFCLAGEYVRNESYTYDVSFEEGETAVYVTGKTGTIVIVQVVGQVLPDSIVNMVTSLYQEVGKLSDISVVTSPETFADAINKLGTLNLSRGIRYLSVNEAMELYENTALRNRFIYGTVGGAIQYTQAYGGNDVRTATIPLDGVTSVTYPVFKTTSGYGSLIVDENSSVVQTLFNTTEDTGTLATIDTSAYSSGGYKILVSVYPFSTSGQLIITLSQSGGSAREVNLLDYVGGLLVDNLDSPSQDRTISTYGLDKLLRKKSNLSFPFKDFGAMPSCLATDPNNFLPDGVDGGGDALVTYSDVIAKYDELVAAYPGYVTKTALGYDASGTIMMYSYTFEPKYWKQSVYLQAGVHGWEPDPVFALAEIMYLIANVYGDGAGEPFDADNNILLWLRGNVKFTIVPVVNPWGFNDRGDCVYSAARRGQNNYNNVQLNADWGSVNPQPECAYVKAILTALKDEISFSIDMHSTVHDDTRTRYGCFYGGYNAGADNVLTLMRTYEWLYRFYDVKYPSIVQGASAPNPLGGGYASIGTMTNVFSSWCLATFGVQSSTMEFSDHVWTPELHTSVALSVAVNMYLNQIVQQICDAYVVAGDATLPQSDEYPAKG